MKRINIHINKKFNYSLYVLCFLLAVIFTCCEEEQHSPINKGGGIPGQVTNIQIIPTPGGADLIYVLPDDRDLSYIEAIVNTPEGNSLNFKASTFKDTISINGLATENTQEVLLYSVTKSGKRSQPLSVNINPVTPPYIKSYESLKLQEGLGGLSVNFINETKAELSFTVGRVIDGEFIEGESYYTSKPEGSILFWGYEATPQKFGVYVCDRWNHYSDTIYADITPKLELLLDKNKFKAVHLNHDSEYKTSQYEKPENLWNGHWSEDYNNPYTGGGTGWAHGALYEITDTEEPAAMTIDLGQLCDISRIRFNHYWTYDNHAPKKYEVYGLLDFDNDYIQRSHGEWVNWTLLATVENVKPSTVGGTADEDAKSWEEGDVVVLSPPASNVRYIRLKAIESWNGKRNLDLAEITVYGQPIE